MNEFLSKFSLQNFLRQFFCGVVFFLPLYLFVLWKVHEFFFQSGICCKKQLICIGALACVIGTLIYHLEKNLYSYVIQGICECERYVRLCISLIVAFLLIIVAVLEFFYSVLTISFFYHLFFVISVVLLIFSEKLYKKTKKQH